MPEKSTRSSAAPYGDLGADRERPVPLAVVVHYRLARRLAIRKALDLLASQRFRVVLETVHDLQHILPAELAEDRAEPSLGGSKRDDLGVQVPHRLVRHPRVGADHLLQHRIELAVVHGELDAREQHSVVKDLRRAPDDSGGDASEIEVMGDRARDADPLAVHEYRHEQRDVVEVLAAVIRVVRDHQLVGLPAR